METTLLVEKEQLLELAKSVLTLLETKPTEGAVVVALSGDLGAGKTTFVQTLGALLGVSETMTSPTFTIMRGYETTHPTFKSLVHMDAYRIDDLAELGPLRFEELLATPRTLICIEWAEKLAPALPPPALTLTFVVTSETARTVQISDPSVHSPGS